MANSNKFDSIFRKRAREIKLKPSTSVWKSIDKNLSNKRSIFSLPIMGLAAAVMLLLAITVVMKSNTTEYENPGYQVNSLGKGNPPSYDQALLTWVHQNNKIIFPDR